MRWMAHTLVIVDQIDAVGVQWTRGRQAVIHVILADLSSETRDACTIKLSSINGFATAAI